MSRDIPFLDSEDAAGFDGEFFRSEYDKIVLYFPENATDLPGHSRVLVSVSRPALPGEAVAVATNKGIAVIGFYCQRGNEVFIESLHHHVRLKYHKHDEKTFIRWMFPVLQVEIFCGSHPDKRFAKKQLVKNGV